MEIVVHSNNSVSNKISKETTPFQQARVRIPNLGVECINYSIGRLMSELGKKTTPSPSVLKNPTPPKKL